MIEPLLADDFTFSSPLDDRISRQRYFERCWPNSEHLDRFDLLETAEAGDKVFVRYRAHPTTGPDFENTEVFTFAGGKISHVDVYFGREIGTPGDAAGTTNADKEIRQAIEAWADAIRAKNAAVLVTHFAPESVRFYLAPPLKADLPLKENAEKWFATFRGPIGYEIRDLKISASGEVAFAHSLNRVSGTKLDGTPVNLWFRETLGLRKIDGHWRIAHEHESVPFLMDGSNQAALDLQP